MPDGLLDRFASPGQADRTIEEQLAKRAGTLLEATSHWQNASESLLEAISHWQNASESLLEAISHWPIALESLLEAISRWPSALGSLLEATFHLRIAFRTPPPTPVSASCPP